MSELGTIISPNTGQSVLVIVQSEHEEKVWMARRNSITNPNKPSNKDLLLFNMKKDGNINDLVDRTSTLRKSILRGKPGDVLNYVTLENYGKRSYAPL
jgi:hypothetical protein